MSQTENTIFCDGCGAEIVGVPLHRKGTGPLNRRDFCCQDCMDGKPCICGERMQLGDEYRQQTQLAEAGD